MISTINFDHCFKFLSKPENFNDTYCQKCRNTGMSLYKESIYYFPNYLIIILNRGKGNIFNCKVDIPKEFTPSIYVEKDKNCKFTLIGVVSHFGESNMGGHFIAFCRHSIDGKWRCYNDSTVTESQNDFLEKGVPYILFYQKNLKDNLNNQNIFGNVFNNNTFQQNNIISNNDYLKVMNINMNNNNNNIQLNNNMNNNIFPNMCNSNNMGQNMNMNFNNNISNNINMNYSYMNMNLGENMNMNSNSNIINGNFYPNFNMNTNF